MFQARFEMEGGEWKPGETYIARAAHDSSYNEYEFAIDQRSLLSSQTNPYTWQVAT